MKSAPAIGWSEVAGQEAELVRRCSIGDEDACRSLVSEHQRLVFQLALHLLRDHEEALDLSQEVFLRVFHTIHRFGGRSSLRTWIYRIVVNQARNRQRWWRRRHRSQVVSLDDHLARHGEIAGSDADGPDRLLMQKFRSAVVWAALDRLPFDQRTAMILREIDGLSYEEIAFSLGVAVGTVKSRLARARASLKLALRP